MSERSRSKKRKITPRKLPGGGRATDGARRSGSQRPPRSPDGAKRSTAANASDHATEANRIRALQRQAVEAQRSYSYPQAIELFGQALDRIHAASARVDPEIEYQLLGGRAACSRRIGNSEEARADYEAMARIAKQEGNPTLEVQALNELAQVVINRGDFKFADRKAKAALRLARSLGDRKLEADGLVSLGEVKRAVGEPADSQALLEKALGLYRRLGDRAGEASSLRRLGRLSIAIGETARGLTYLNEALPLYRGIGDLEGEGHTLNSMALGSSNHYETRTIGEQALALFQTIGDVDGQSTMYNNLGLMYANLGLYRTASEYTSRAVEMAKRARARLLTSTYLESLGRAELDHGDLDNAERTLQEGLNLSLEIGHSHNEAYYRLGLGRLALARQEVDLARKEVTAAAEYFRELPSPSELAVSLAWLGYIQLQAGDWQAAHRSTSEAVAQIEALGDVSWDYPPQDVWWLHYQVLKAARAQTQADRPEPTQSRAPTGAPELGFGQLTDTYAWMVLQRARQVALSGIAKLSDEGLRRNYLNKVEINRQIIAEWVRGAEARGLSLEVDQARPGNLQEQLQRMLAIGARMNERRDLEGLLEFVMDQLVELSGAERVVLAFLDESGEPKVSATRGHLSAGRELPAGASLLFDTVADSMRPVLRQAFSASNPEADQPSDTPDSLSVLALPLISRGQLTGLIYLDNHTIYGPFTQSDVDLLSAFANQAASAIENARLYQGLEQRVAERTAELERANQIMEQRAAELEIISSVEQALASKLEIQEVFDLVGDKIRDVFEAQVVMIMTYDRDSDRVHYRYMIERGERFYLEPEAMGEKGFAPHILRSRKPLMINRDLQDRAEEYGSYVVAGEHVKSYLGVPLIIGDEAKGVISLQNLDREDAFTDSDLRLLTTLASSMAVALENVRLFDETRRRANEMSALAEIAREVSATLDLEAVLKQIGSRAMDLLRSRTVQLRLLAEDGQTLKSVVALGHNAEAFAATDMKLGEGISGMVAKTGRPEVINDPLKETRAKHVPGTPVGDPTAFMVVPLAAGEAIIGTMGVWRLVERGRFTEEDLDLLVSLGRQAAIAIQNARLFQQVEREKVYSESLVKSSPVAIVNIDEQDAIVSWNPGAEKLFGYTAKEAIGQNIDDLLVSQELREEAIAYNRQVQADGRISVTTRRRRKDGTLVDVDLHGVPLQSDGRAAGAIAIYHDITERVRAEQELRNQKQYIEAVVQYSPVAIVTIDFHANVMGWNPAAERLFGYTADEAIGRNVDELVAKDPALRSEAVAYSDKGIRGDSFHAITKRTRKDGSLIDVVLQGVSVIVGGERVGMIAIYHDISELKRAEEALREQKQYLEAVVQNSPVAIITTDLRFEEGSRDLEPHVVSWNPAAEKLFGYTAEEAIGRNLDDLVANLDEIRVEAASFNKYSASGELLRAVARRTRKDGSLVDVEVLALPVKLGQVQQGVIVIYYDITELMLARKSAEAANEAKSAFLATMSHEIRTPMNAVIGMSGLLLDTTLTPEQREFAEIIRNSGDSLLMIINDILDFSKIEAGKMELESQPLDLRECIESAMDLVAPRAAEKALELAYQLEEFVPRAIVGDVTRLRQILINLLGNAVKFTERGEVVLSVAASRRAWAHDLHFTVHDTGVGIAPDQIGRLFQSFSQADASTARKHGGTGLGLAISRRLVELMGGRMWAESEPGVGSTFHFTIVTQPAELPQAARPEHTGEQPRLVGKRVLIVDDNETNRRILVAQVQSWGMTPLETGSPRLALDWVRRGETFDLAILDMHMPEMDGVSLAKEIRSHPTSAQIPLVLFTSLGRREADLQSLDFAAQLTKPIKPSQLFDALVGVFAGQAELAAEGDGRPKARMDPDMARRHPLRILLAEDNAVNQKLALRLLQGMGYRADVAGNGLEAIQSLERQRYDVVLMDVQMPEMDGLEASREIHRRWNNDQRPRIVAMTANAMQGDRELCMAAGMDDYIAKPIRVPDLVGALSKVSARPIEGP